MYGFKDYFSATADTYAQARPRYPETLASCLAALAPDLNCAVDVGCGNGQLSLLLAEHFRTVHAIDGSSAQLGQASPHPHISYRCATAEHTQLPAHCADLITAAQAAHWFDLPAFYAECHRLARPDALIALISYGVMEIPGPACDVFAEFYWHHLGPYWPAERQLVESGYRGLDFPFEEISPPQLAMSGDWDLDHVLGYISTWSAVQAARNAGAGELLRDFTTALTRAWGPPDQRQTVRWPLRLRLGRIGARTP